VACYIPKEKGGYGLMEPSQELSDSMTQYTLSRRSTSNQFSLFGNDTGNLNVHVSVSGNDKLRMTIRDANAQRYEVPVPIQWQSLAPSASSPAQIKFELTKTENQQIGFRIRRTNTNSIIFDTSFFAEGFIYDDKYIQIITTIPSRNAYGKIDL
jgi:hypothetical protein